MQTSSRNNLHSNTESSSHEFNHILSITEPEKCQSHESKEYPSECFSFQIPKDIDVATVESAQLWVYKEPG